MEYQKFKSLEDRYDFWNTGVHPITGWLPTKELFNPEVKQRTLIAEYHK